MTEEEKKRIPDPTPIATDQNPHVIAETIHDNKKKHNMSIEDQLIVAEVVAKRVMQIFAQNEINTLEFAKVHGGWFYQEKIQRFPDGTYNILPGSNRLEDFLTGNNPSILPNETDYRRFETLLNYQRNQILTFYSNQITLDQWFQALDYRDSEGRPTEKYRLCPRLLNYQKWQRAEIKRLEELAKENAKIDAEVRKAEEKERKQYEKEMKVDPFTLHEQGMKIARGIFAGTEVE